MSTVPGITVHDSEVLEPEHPRPGGLMRMDMVCPKLSNGLSNYLYSLQRHTFRQPANPLEPATPRASLLGLDKLAQEKRSANLFVNDTLSRKKPRLENGDGPAFKGK